MMEAFLVSSTCSYAKNVYYEKHNFNAKFMFVLKFKKEIFERMLKHRFFLKGGVIPTQAFSKTPRSQFTVFSLQYAFELTLLQLGLLRVVTWPVTPQILP